MINGSPVDLADLFAVAQEMIAAHQQEINGLDGYNGNHGDNMVQNMRRENEKGESTDGKTRDH
jgi:hypothetical protein